MSTSEGYIWVGATAALLLLGCGGGDTAATGDPTPAGPDDEAGGTEADRWTVQFELELTTSLVAEVTTTEGCCGGLSEPEGSPARLYLAPPQGAGYLLFLGQDDAAVLAAQTSPGVYDRELFRSAEPAPRNDSTVTLTIPADVLPGGDLRIWAATRSDTTVGGKELSLKLEDGTIPCAILHTGKPAEASVVPPPPGTPPSSGEPTIPRTTGGPGDEPPTASKPL